MVPPHLLRAVEIRLLQPTVSRIFRHESQKNFRAHFDESTNCFITGLNELAHLESNGEKKCESPKKSSHCFTFFSMLVSGFQIVSLCPSLQLRQSDCGEKQTYKPFNLFN